MRSRILVVLLVVAALAGCVGQDGGQDAAPANTSDPAPDRPDNRTADRANATEDPAGNNATATNASIGVDLVWATDQAVVRWNATTGNLSQIDLSDAAGDSYEITAIRWGPDGALYATTMAASSGPVGLGWATSGGQGVFRIDVAAGSVEAVHTGPPLKNPLALAVLDDGTILVADRGEVGWPPGGAPSPSGQILQISSDGTPTVLTADVRFGGWLGMGAIGGDVYLTTQNDQRLTSPQDADGTGALWTIDPATGTHQLVSSSSAIQQPSGVAPAGDGIYVSEWTGQRVLEVDPSSGEATVVSPVNGSQNLWGLDTLPDGRIVAGAQDGIWLVDPGAGAARKLVAADDAPTRHVRVVGPS